MGTILSRKTARGTPSSGARPDGVDRRVDRAEGV